jgi:hypothetical protein
MAMRALVCKTETVVYHEIDFSDVKKNGAVTSPVLKQIQTLGRSRRRVGLDYRRCAATAIVPAC